MFWYGGVQEKYVRKDIVRKSMNSGWFIGRITGESNFHSIGFMVQSAKVRYQYGIFRCRAPNLIGNGGLFGSEMK